MFLLIAAIIVFCFTAFALGVGLHALFFDPHYTPSGTKLTTMFAIWTFSGWYIFDY